MLKSRSLAEEVVRELGLNVKALEPQPPGAGQGGPMSAYRWLTDAGSFARRSDVIASVSVTAEVQPGRYLLDYQGGLWTARRNGEVLARAAAGEPLELAGVRVLLRRPKRRSRASLEIGVTRLRDAVGGLLGRLDVSLPVREANVIRVTYRDPDPEVARSVVNAVASKFIAQSSIANKTEARSTREFIQAHLARISEELKLREDELQAYRERAQVVSLPAEAEEAIHNLARLQAERDQYVTERNSLVSLMGGPESEAAESASDLSTFPSFIQNEAIQQLKTQENELESAKSRLLAERMPAHPDVSTVQEQLDRVRESLRRAAHGYRAALESKIEAIDQTLRGFQVELERLPAKDIGLARFVRAQKVAEELYMQLQTKLQEAQVAEAMELASIRVIDPALKPESPVTPKRRLNITLTVLLGLFLGCGAAFAREYFDDTLRTKEHVERDLRLPIVGLVPVIGRNARKVVRSNGSKSRVSRVARRSSGRESVVSRIARRDWPPLITQLDPFSVAVEAYRALGTNLALVPQGEPRAAHRTILVTSPIPRDGKSLTAANLAICFGLRGIPTLLIDADLRKGVLHRLFGVADRQGLSDYLSGPATLTQIVRETSVRNLFLIPCGSAAPLTLELLVSDRMDRLLGMVRTEFEVLIIDSPPVLPAADALALAPKADDVLLVVRSGSTGSAAAADALRLLKRAHTARLACVVNAVHLERGYGYGYYGRNASSEPWSADGQNGPGWPGREEPRPGGRAEPPGRRDV